VVLSGPNLAPIWSRAYRASVLASPMPPLPMNSKVKLSSDSFRLYTNSDPWHRVWLEP